MTTALHCRLSHSIPANSSIAESSSNRYGVSLSRCMIILVAVSDVNTCCGEILNPISVSREMMSFFDSLVVFVTNRITRSVSLSLQSIIYTVYSVMRW